MKFTTVDPKRSQYVHVAKGSIQVNDIKLKAGDGLQILGGNSLLHFSKGVGANVLLFDLNPV